MKKQILIVASAALFASSAIANGHLELARELLSEVTPDHNSYAYNGWVRWKGDRVLFFEATASEVRTDCSGLIDALLDRAHSETFDIIKSKTLWRKYPKAENYYQAIQEGLGFERRTVINSATPGDIIALRYPNASDTGHVMLVDDFPQQIEPHPPILPDTLQWAVSIIDSTATPHSDTDTRFATKATGIGRGDIRIYTDLSGVPVGYAWGIYKTKVYRTDQRPLAIGKPY